MLILTRKPGQSLYIGDDIVITIVETKGNQIRIGIEAPKSYRIYREEIYRQILEENKKAAATPEQAGIEGLAGLAGVFKGKSRRDMGAVSVKLKPPLADAGHETGIGETEIGETEIGETGVGPRGGAGVKQLDVVIRRRRNRSSDE